MGKVTETLKAVKAGAKAVKKAVDKKKGKPKAKEKIDPPLTAAQNRARLEKIRKKEAPARARLQRIKDKIESRDDIDPDAPEKPLTGVEKFNAKAMKVNTKGKTPEQVRYDTREKLVEKEISAEKSAYEPRFNKKGGIIKKKKKKVVKLKVGGALSDYYKGMM